MPDASAICSSSDGAYYWTGSINDSASFNGQIIDTKGKTHFVLGKISREGEHIWVKTIPGNMRGLSIDSKQKRIAVQVEIYANILVEGDTLLRDNLGKYDYAVLLFEDDNNVGIEPRTPSRTSIWPNPSKGLINLGVHSSYTVLNIHGQQVLSGQGNSIDLFNQADGVYFVVLGSGESQMIVLQK